MKNSSISIALADDHTIVRAGTAAIIKSMSNLNVIVEADNGQELINYLSNTNTLPDLVILDVYMPVMNGYQTLTILRQFWPQIKILILSTYNHDFLIATMLRDGANGYIFKSDSAEELIEGIFDVMYKGFYMTRTPAKFLSSLSNLPRLTEQHKLFLQLCCTELTYEGIAEVMKVKPRTIEGYRATLSEMLRLHTRTGFVLFATRNGLSL
ncbi:MAG: hypothetical protein BGO70_01165 [Bacteroidetes bacterium 43-93]|uniref:response regulator transcription factor n=1 Tax=uncultured Dysgonomonas sp. TaxID=206096 RepID=UPI00092616D9|nr:response regulator transcription factor [uncultured Dysgonomonas sp.]MBN9483113.1 response regulator transcription factor [Bacteroidota bacterium]OJW96322.1 MAG: hypothetical protein BGO70_01165 [Bacteroidetes bacterium 43-93]